MQLLKNAVLLLGLVGVGGFGGGALARWWFAPAEPPAIERLSELPPALGALRQPVLFTLSTCPACAQLKAWLGQRGQRYHELSVDTDPEAERLARELGVQSVPVLFTATHRISGYVPEQIEPLLAAPAAP